MYRGPNFESVCLYDYASLVYKKKRQGGTSFDAYRVQASYYSQYVREETAAVPNLIGRLLFINPDTDDADESEDFFRILTGLFVPWGREGVRKAQEESWEQHFSNLKHQLSPRIRRYVENLGLLHKTSKEIELDRLQREANGRDDWDEVAQAAESYYVEDENSI